ncbi:IS66 Orf2 like protein [compost metagenome]|jgi:transposase
MMRPNASVEKVYLYPKPVDFRKSINGLAALSNWISKSWCLTVLFVFLNRHRNRVKVLYWGCRERWRKPAMLYQRWE